MKVNCLKRLGSPRALRNIAVMCGCFLLATAAYIELRHWAKYGHLVSYGLHVDAMNENYSIAIPGQTKMYWPEVSNFTLLPVRLPACRPVTDILHPPLEYPFAIQRFDEQTKTWQTIIDATRFQFCVNPYTHQSQVTHTYLLPGSSVRVMSGAAVGAVQPFRKDDLARWVVFPAVSPSANWDSAVASSPLRIEDDVQTDEGGSFRIAH